MKKALLFLTLAVGLFSCSTKSTEKQTATNTTTGEVKDHVELVYFHGKQRCITCRAIEKYSKEVVDPLNATLSEWLISTRTSLLQTVTK